MRLTSEDGPSMTDEQAVEVIETMPDTCRLDVVERGGGTLEEIGVMAGVSRERIRQLETSGLKKVRRRERLHGTLAPHRGDASLGPADWTASAHAGHASAAFAGGPREPAPAPAHAAQLPGVAEVGEGGEFWCGWLSAVMPVWRCVARQTARRESAPGTQGRALHEECASCPDGQALRARVGDVARPTAELPTRRRLPVLQGVARVDGGAAVVAAPVVKTTKEAPVARGTKTMSELIAGAEAEGNEPPTAAAPAGEAVLCSKCVKHPVPAVTPKTPKGTETQCACCRRMASKVANAEAASAKVKRGPGRPKKAAARVEHEPITHKLALPDPAALLSGALRRMVGEQVTEARVREIVREEFAKAFAAVA